ncbi:MAG: C39 family peptidase, partial [Oscillospiraceae bacterium]|nr:C39 family peptidase [Oscillospiraceae bacterium]
MKNNTERLKIYYVPENNKDSKDNINKRNKKYYQHYIDNAGSAKINKYAIDDYFKMREEEKYKPDEKTKKMSSSYISGKYKMRVYQSFSFILVIAVIITGMIISKFQNLPVYVSDVGSAASLNRDSKTLNNIFPAIYDQTNDIYVKADESARNTAILNAAKAISSSEAVLNYVKKYNMKYINQIEDKMPNGCEVVSLTMVLSRYIPNISSHEIYSEYMPSKPLPSLYHDVYIGEDPTNYYIGNPEGMGYGIFSPGLVKTAQNTL